MEKSPRIRMLITVFDLHFGGISNLILQTTPALQQNLDVEVVYFGPREEMLERYQKAGIPVHRIKYIGIRDLLRAGRELAKYILENKIEVVSCHLYLDKLITTIARKYAQFKIIGTFHSINNPYESKKIKYKLESKFEDYFHNKIADKNFAVSQAALSSWKKFRNLKNPNSIVLYSGIEKVNCRDEKDGLLNKEKKIFVTACRISPEKGLDRLLSILAKLNKKHKNWEFWIVGNGYLFPQLNEQAGELGLNSKISFKGFQTNLCPFYLQADFYINSSYQEALPVSILEAMSLGLPVVGSNVGGIPEILTHDEDGYIVDFQNNDEALNILTKCLAINEGKYAELSLNAKQKFNSQFSIVRYRENITRELEDLVRRKQMSKDLISS